MDEFERSDLRDEWETSNMRKCINEVYDAGYVFWLESKLIAFINSAPPYNVRESAPFASTNTVSQKER
jgi:hypothetical protein